MNILGLSGGREMGNSEVLLRAALMEAKEVNNIDVELIRLWNLNFKPPLGADDKETRQRDHTAFLRKKIRTSDAIILSCPSYALTPPGYVINIRDKVSLRGLPEKMRPCALIGVGGSDWTSLTLPLMYTVLPHGESKLVDQLLVQFEVHLGQVVLNEKVMARARKLGRNVAEAMKMPIEEAKYVSEEPWACPLCRQNLLIIRGKQVECSICDIRGTVEITEDGIRVDFSQEDLQTYRWGPDGVKRHNDIIRKQIEPYKKNKEEINRKLKLLEDALDVSVPPEETEHSISDLAEEEPVGKKTLLDI